MKTSAPTTTRRRSTHGVGNVTTYQVTALPSNGQQYTNFYGVGYAKFDTYKQNVVNGNSTLLQPGSTTTAYDLNGDIDYPTAADLARINLRIALDVANTTAPPRWKAGDFFGDEFAPPQPRRGVNEGR